MLPTPDLKISPPTLPGPIRRRRQIQQLQPFEPTLGKVFQLSKEKEIPKNATQVNTLISVLVVPESVILSPTTTLYRQNTTVPVLFTTPPPTSAPVLPPPVPSPAITHSEPVFTST